MNICCAGREKEIVQSTSETEQCLAETQKATDSNFVVSCASAEDTNLSKETDEPSTSRGSLSEEPPSSSIVEMKKTSALNDEVLPPSAKRTKFNKGKGNSKTDITNSIFDWKKSVIDLEKERFEAEDRKRYLECYNLTLQNMTLERQLGMLKWLATVFSFILIELKFKF